MMKLLLPKRWFSKGSLLKCILARQKPQEGIKRLAFVIIEGVVVTCCAFTKLALHWTAAGRLVSSLCPSALVWALLGALA